MVLGSTLLVLAVVALLFLALLRSLAGLLIHGAAGIALLLLTHEALVPPLPINLLTALICGVGGVSGYLFILVLHVLGLAF